MFSDFKRIFLMKGSDSKVRVFNEDHERIIELQKEIARDLDLVSVSQAQVIKYLLDFREAHLNEKE